MLPPPALPPVALGQPYAVDAGNRAYFAGRLPEALQLWSTVAGTQIPEGGAVHNMDALGAPAVVSALDIMHRAYTTCPDIKSMLDMLELARLCAPQCFVVLYQLGFVLLAHSGNARDAKAVFDRAVYLVACWESYNPSVGKEFSQNMQRYLRLYLQQGDFPKNTVTSAIAAWQQMAVRICARSAA